MVDAKESVSLSAHQRNELERLLMEFDEGWKSGLLAEYLERVGHADSRDFAHLASLELIKIDVHRQCAASSDVRVEDYLLEYQACLDQPNDVVDLLLTEFQARRRNRPDLELASYQSRFPEHYAHLCQLVAESGDSIFSPQTPSAVESTCQALASIETSQVSRPDRQSRAESKTSLPLNFGRYNIIRELGAGAMGAVYLAHDTKLDRQVALKTPSFVGDNNEELVARFYLEARAAAKIHHRNICPIHDVGEIDGIHFLSMAFVRGRSMSEYINCDKLPSEKACAALIQRLADAMTEAHRHNVIHRDLKPTNIMIDTKREPIIMDFGLARQTDSECHVTQSGMIVGTPAYMSPEQVTGESGQVTPAVDIYALGVILYELLTGKLPFQGTISQVIYKITYQDPVRPSELRTDLDPRLESICLKMMAKRREDRHLSMEEVSSELKSYLQQKSGEAHSKANSHSLDVPQSTRKPKQPVDLKEQTETDSINEFLAATNSQQANRTLVEASSSQFIAPEAERSDRERDNSRSGSIGKRRRIQASIIVGGFALLCGVVILFKGGKVELEDGSKAVVDVASNGDVTIRSVDLQVKQTAKTLSSSQNEWISLFDGNTLDGWTPVGNDGWRVEDKNIVGTASLGEFGWLRSNETFDDFELELEYWLGAESNSGVFLRADSNGDDSGKGLLEIQLLDDTAEKFSAINPAQHSGSLYGLIAARPTILPMPNEWHTLSVKVEGNQLQVSIDSQRVLDGDIPSERQASGHIGLQLYSSQVRFRNVRLRKLEESLPGVVESGGSSTELSVKTTPGDQGRPQADPLGRYFTIQNEGGGSQFAVSPDGLTIVTTGSGSPGRFTFWDLKTREPLFQFTDPNHSGMGSRDLAFSPDGTHFLYVINKYVKVLNLQTKSIESQYEFPATPMMTTLQDRNRAAAIHYEREIHQRDRARVPQRLRIWDWKTGDILFDQAMDYSRNISITPDGKYLFRSRENYHVRHTINGSDTALTLGREVKFEKTSRTRSQLTFSPDGRFAANSLKSKNGMAVLLDVATGQVVRYLEPELARSNNESHEYGASVAFTSDGSQIVTANHLGKIALWDCESGDFISEITTFAKNSSHWTPRLHISNRNQLFIGMSPIQVWNLESLKAGENSNKTSSQNNLSQSEDDRQIAEHIIHDLEAGVELETRDWYWGELPDGEVRVKSVFFKGQGGRVVSDQDLLLLSNLKGLESIEFGQTAITSDGFVQLGKLTSLKKLGFSVESLTNDGLAKLQQLPRLESLELIHTDVTDDGLEMLAKFSALRNLSLSVSPKKKFGPGYLSDEGLSHLTSIPRLEQLSLYGPTFTDRGIEHLSQLKSLDCLRIWAPNITDTGIQKLQEQLPDCEVMDKR